MKKKLVTVAFNVQNSLKDIHDALIYNGENRAKVFIVLDGGEYEIITVVEMLERLIGDIESALHY